MADAGVKRKQPLTDEQEEEEEERMEAAVELVAEMQLTAEQLKVGGLPTSPAAPRSHSTAST